MTSRLRLTVAPVLALLIASCSGVASHPVSNTTASSSATIRVTTPADCQPGITHTITIFPLRLSDNRRQVQMVPCQDVGIELLHNPGDGCSWDAPTSSNDGVIAILPIPLPAPPPGGTLEDFVSVSPGEATLSSQIRCPNDVLGTGWIVSIVVGLNNSSSTLGRASNSAGWISEVIPTEDGQWQLAVTVLGSISVLGGCTASLTASVLATDLVPVPTATPMIGASCMAIVILSIPAGAIRTFQVTVPRPQLPGTYTAIGFLHTQGDASPSVPSVTITTH
jgi:hypothetical protein